MNESCSLGTVPAQVSVAREISHVSRSSTATCSIDASPRETQQGACGDDANSSKEFRIGLLALNASLRSYAFSLCRDRELAEDLVQDASCKAWASRVHFQRGSNLKAWVFTILRNLFYSHRKHAWRQQAWNDDIVLNMPAADNEQSWAVQLSDAVGALRCLPSEQRDVLILVAVGGLAYADAAAICKCPVGTAKSRVARARKAILAVLEDSRSLSSGYRPSVDGATQDILAELDRLTRH